MMYHLDKHIKEVRAGKRYKYLFFWGHQPNRNGTIGKQCLSQWYYSPFKVDDIIYPTAEHYILAEKARLFNDDVTLKRIISSSDASAAKRYGREVLGFDKEIWQTNRNKIVITGNFNKFNQNNALREFLVNTKRRTLVEASPIDNIWGIGLAKDNTKIENPEKWRGLNLLGFALMEVRDLLSKKY